MSPSRPPVRHRLPVGYGCGTIRILRAAVRAIRPSGGLFDQDVDEAVVRDCLSFVPFMPAPARWGLPLGLRMIEFAPLFFGFGLRRFSSLPEDRVTVFLGRVAHAMPPLSMVYIGLRALVLIVFYQQPQVLASLGVDWQRRAEELTVRRARLLEMPADLSNPRNTVGGGLA